MGRRLLSEVIRRMDSIYTWMDGTPSSRDTATQSGVL